MFVLEVIAGPYKGQAVQLAKGQVVTIGRSLDCSVVLNDPQLSQRHAEFDWTDNGFSVFDLGSSNGCYVNGKRIQGRVGMSIGDHLQVGQTIFQLGDIDVETSEVSLIEAEGPKKGQMLALGTSKTEIVPRTRGRTIVNAPKLLASQKTSIHQKVAELRVDDEVLSGVAKLKDMVAKGGQGAKVIVRREGRFDPFWSVPVTIGRERGSGIVLDDAAVSLRHAVIDHREGAFSIRDVGSSNGTFINGKRVVEQRLADGDVIGAGSFAMLVALGSCLGLDVQAPALAEQPARTPSGRAIGVIEPLARKATASAKKKKKKASELVWYATSDLDRGVFRARSALLAMMLAIVFSGWMLATGDSEILASNRLSDAHESADFLGRAEGLARDRCTACHIGAARTSTLLCLDCHPENRPTSGHAAKDVECAHCHAEHRGTAYRSAAAATLDCMRCHASPHDALERDQPKLVAGFRIDAEADVQLHVSHEVKEVKCLACHDEARHTARGIRGTCGRCHAPDHPAREDCQLCHFGHPDRTRTSSVVTAPPVTIEPARFATKSLPWILGLLVLSFLGGAIIPRKRKVAIEPAAEDA
jgi:pSer/pThr/pTyr-binding forkhead associated (FHA) protein